MAWPPALDNISNGALTKGTYPSILAWGTDGIANITGAIVKSVRESVMSDEVKIENGTGLTCRNIVLADGFQVEITVEDDRNISWPGVGANVSIYHPLDANANVSSATTYEVINLDYNAARKQNGERVILAKRYTTATTIP